MYAQKQFVTYVPIIIIIPNGCPLCNEEIRGNEKYKFYCKNCNMFFRRIVHN